MGSLARMNRQERGQFRLYGGAGGKKNGEMEGKEFQRILGEQQQDGQGQYVAPLALLSDLFLRVE